VLVGALAACNKPVARIFIAGDVHLGSDVGDRLEPLRPLLVKRVGFVNLEGPVCASAPPGDGLRLHNDPATPRALFDVGIGVVSVANNHGLDAGPGGFDATVAALRNAHLKPVGGPGSTVTTSHRPAVGWVAHGLPGDATATFAAAIKRSRASATFVVASIHVTGPPSYLPSEPTQQAVNSALKAGADVVAVHGQHTIGKITRHGRQVVAWGLGNVAFTCDCTHEKEALGLAIDLRADAPPKVEIVPLRAGLGGEKARLSDDAAGVLKLLSSLGTRLGQRTGRGAMLAVCGGEG